MCREVLHRPFSSDRILNNQLRFDEVTVIYLGCLFFFWDTVYIIHETILYSVLKFQ